MLTALLVLAGLALEAASIVLLLQGLWEGWAAHAVGATLFVPPCLRLAGIDSRSRPAAAWLGSWALAVPVAGPASALLAAAVLGRLKPRQAKAPEPVIGVPGESATASPTRPARDILRVLSEPGTERRRLWISALRGRPSAGAVLILQRAVYDSDDFVRTSAQAMLERWTVDAELRIKSLAAATARPGEPARTRLALAHCCLHFVDSLLAGPELEAKYLRVGADAAEGVANDDPLRPLADLAALRCHVAAGDADSARACLRRLDAVKFSHPALCAARLEIAFRSRDWAALRKGLRTLPEDLCGEPWAARSDLWARFAMPA